MYVRACVNVYVCLDLMGVVCVPVFAFAFIVVHPWRQRAQGDVDGGREDYQEAAEYLRMCIEAAEALRGNSEESYVLSRVRARIGWRRTREASELSFCL